MTFTVIGMVVMVNTPEEQTKEGQFINTTKYFDNYLDAFFNLFVLMTTANYPDVMLPAYG